MIKFSDIFTHENKCCFVAFKWGPVIDYKLNFQLRKLYRWSATAFVKSFNEMDLMQ